MNVEMLIETLEAIIKNRWVLYKAYNDEADEKSANLQLMEMCCYMECLNMIRDAGYLTRMNNIYCPSKEAATNE